VVTRPDLFLISIVNRLAQGACRGIVIVMKSFNVVAKRND